MGILNKLLFWKKDEDELDFDKIAEKEMQDLSTPSEKTNKSEFEEESGFSPSRESALRPSAFSQQNESVNQRELELINSKLDTIKVMLASIEQRLASLEQSKAAENKPPRLW